MYLKSCFLITLLALPSFIFASNEEALCIYTKDGCRAFFCFQNKPKVVIKDNILEITAGDEIVKYPLDNFAKFTFENEETTSIDTIKDTTYTIKSNIITTKGQISVFDLSGKVVAQSESGEISLTDAPKGVCLTKTKNVSFKYLKK